MAHVWRQMLGWTALDRALAQCSPEIYHSDEDVRYAAQGYVERLEGVGAQISMAAAAQPTENPYAERVIWTIKGEEVTPLLVRYIPTRGKDSIWPSLVDAGPMAGAAVGRQRRRTCSEASE